MAMGEGDDWSFFKVANDAALAAKLFQTLNQKSTWPGLTEPEAHLLFTPEWRTQLHGLAMDSLVDELRPYLLLRTDTRGELFVIHNDCLRWTQNMITFYRAFVEVRCPFLHTCAPTLNCGAPCCSAKCRT